MVTVKLETDEIQRAVDDAAAAGGGVVRIGPGTHECGTIHLRSRVTIDLAPGATLMATADDAAFDSFEDLPYTPFADQETSDFRYALLAGEDLEDVAIVGQGCLDDARHRRIGPKPVALKRCRRVTVSGITIQHAPNYAVSLLGCDHVVVHGVTILDGYADGIDPDCCRFVRISDCHVDCWDDAICLKASLSLGERRPTEHVTVTNCTLRSCCNHLKLGTESSGDFRHIAFTNCTMLARPDDAPVPSVENAGLAIESVDGARIVGLVASNLAMDEVRTPIFVRLGNRGRGMDTPVPGAIEDVVISNVVAHGACETSSITGLAERAVAGVTLRDVRVRSAGGQRVPGPAAVPEVEGEYPAATMFGPLPAHGLYVRHVRRLSLHDVELTTDETDARPGLAAEDVT